MKGITERKNNNGFHVFELHYSADADKDPDTEAGKKWIKAEKVGMPESKWRQEYEIDWFALSGDLIYPEFSKEKHLIEPFIIPKDWTRYMAIDPGLQKPTAMLWCAVDPEDNVVFYREHYVAEQTIKWHCDRIKEYESDEEILCRYIDSAANIRNFATKRTNVEDYSDEGIHCLNANKDVPAGINRVKEYLIEGKLKIFNTLTNTINEFKNYRWQELTEKQAQTRDPKEKPVKKEDHLMDLVRYLLMANLFYVDMSKMRIDNIPRKTFASGIYDTGYW